MITSSLFPCTDSRYRSPLNGPELRTRVANVLKHTAKNYTTPRDFFDNYSYFFYEVPLPEFRDDSGKIYTVCREIAAYMSHDLVSLFMQRVPQHWSESALKEAIVGLTEHIEKTTNDLRKQGGWIDESGQHPFEDLEMPILNPKDAYKATQLYLRWAIARGGSGPPMHTVMEVLGEDVVIQRLRELCELLSKERIKAAQAGNAKVENSQD